MIVLCPLEFERGALHRAALEHNWNLVCTGPGEGPARWIHNHAELLRAARDGGDDRIALAGVAAGLVAHATAGCAFAAGAVVRGAQTWRPTWHPPRAPTATLVCVDSVLDVVGKRSISAETGAALADMESAPFAEAASAHSMRWCVVRGVSDAVGDALPSDIHAWTDELGATRHGAVVRSVLRRPSLIPKLLRTARASSAAMRAVASLLANADNARPTTSDTNHP